MHTIIEVVEGSDVGVIRELFVEYAASLSIDLCFQGFEQELATLPGPYRPPDGALYLARVGEFAVGCLGLRRFEGDVGELKRLYVRPHWRGTGVGRGLVQAGLEGARRRRYGALVLDTLDSMHAAIRLYESCGFRRTSAYYPNPLPGVVYFRAEI